MLCLHYDAGMSGMQVLIIRMLGMSGMLIADGSYTVSAKFEYISS